MYTHKRQTQAPEGLVPLTLPLLESMDWLVVLVYDDVFHIEDGQQGQEQAAILVVSHTPTIVALSRQICEGRQRQLLIVIQEHLGTQADWPSH